MVTLPYEFRRGVDLADKDLLANESYVYSFSLLTIKTAWPKKTEVWTQTSKKYNKIRHRSARKFYIYFLGMGGGRTRIPHAFSFSRYYTPPGHFHIHGDGPELRDTSAIR